MSPPADLLRRLVASDPGRPRVTVYDDTDSPTRGERVELSARVLANWVAKAANLLQEDLDVTPGSVVRLDLPPHWRTLYWALAVWSVGACVELPAHRCRRGRRAGMPRRTPDAVGAPAASADGATVVVTDDPEAAARAVEDAEHAVLVTLAALARHGIRRRAGRRGRRGQGPRDARRRVRPVGRARPGRSGAAHPRRRDVLRRRSCPDRGRRRSGAHGDHRHGRVPAHGARRVGRRRLGRPRPWDARRPTCSPPGSRPRASPAPPEAADVPATAGRLGFARVVFPANPSSRRADGSARHPGLDGLPRHGADDAGLGQPRGLAGAP